MISAKKKSMKIFFVVLSFLPLLTISSELLTEYHLTESYDPSVKCRTIIQSLFWEKEIESLSNKLSQTIYLKIHRVGIWTQAVWFLWSRSVLLPFVV